jgi:hypothetical protein
MQYDAWTKSILLILIHKSQFTNLPLAFLFINNLTTHSKFNNTHFMTLIMLSDYMKALNSTMKLPTNNEHFPMRILFSIIYSL